MLNTLRWIGFIPISTIVAMAIGFNWSRVFSSASYSEGNAWVSLVGLSPKFVGQAAPVAVFIILATMIAPRSNRALITFLGLAGGAYGMPLEMAFPTGQFIDVFTAVEISGAIFGTALGMLLAFRFSTQRRSRVALNHNLTIDA